MNYILEYNQRAFLKTITKKAASLVIIGLFFTSGVSAVIGKAVPDKQVKRAKHIEFLKSIYRETEELGSYKDEDFIKREFHMELDGKDTNKEEHVVVLIHKFDGRERMILQLTYFKPQKDSLTIKYADDIKIILCNIKEDELELEECDFSEKELRKLLPEILLGIKKKKELLKLINHKKIAFD